MDSVGIRELKRDTSAIIKKVREDKEQVEITFRGEVVARIVPVDSVQERREQVQELWDKMDRLAMKIPEGVGGDSGISIVEALRTERARTLGCS